MSRRTLPARWVSRPIRSGGANQRRIATYRYEQKLLASSTVPGRPPCWKCDVFGVVVGRLRWRGLGEVELGSVSLGQL